MEMSPSKQEMTFNRAYAAELLRIAEGDYSTALALQKANDIRIENAFYMAQQAIEKALKSVLVALGLPVPMVNDLGILIARIPAAHEPPFGYELSELNQYAAIRRYEEGQWTPKVEDFSSVLSKTRLMLDWARSVQVSQNLAP